MIPRLHVAQCHLDRLVPHKSLNSIQRHASVGQASTESISEPVHSCPLDPNSLPCPTQQLAYVGGNTPDIEGTSLPPLVGLTELGEVLGNPRGHRDDPVLLVLRLREDNSTFLEVYIIPHQAHQLPTPHTGIKSNQRYPSFVRQVLQFGQETLDFVV